MASVDEPMGNAELRLTLAGLESEIAEIKSLSISTNEQAKLTNGNVAKLKLWQSYVIGFCACLGLMFISILIPLLVAYIQVHK